MTEYSITLEESDKGTPCHIRISKEDYNFLISRYVKNDESKAFCTLKVMKAGMYDV